MSKRIIINNINDCITFKVFLKRSLNISFPLAKTLIRKKEIKLIDKESQFSSNENLLNHVLRIGNEIILYNFEDKKIEDNSSLTNRKINMYQENKDELTKLLTSMKVYENDSFILLNKMSGISCQGGTKINFSLDEILKYCYSDNTINSNSQSNQFIPKLVHRLDKSVNGLMLIGKTQNFLQSIGSAFQRKTDIEKHYFLISQGFPSIFTTLIDNFRNAKHRNKTKILEEVYNLFYVPLKIHSNEEFTEFVIILNNYIFTSSNFQLTSLTKDISLEKIEEIYPVCGEIMFDYIILQGKHIYSPDNIKDINIDLINSSSTSKDNYTCLTYKLLTGRKHQIRKHMSTSLISPILLDENYFYNKSTSPLVNSLVMKVEEKEMKSSKDTYLSFLNKNKINTISSSIFLTSVRLGISDELLNLDSNSFIKMRNSEYKINYSTHTSPENKSISHIFTLKKFPTFIDGFMEHFNIKY